MENGMWNGELLIAAEISKQYEKEKEIRKASARKELRCPDSGCSDWVLRYCHGEKKGAYFAHLNNVCCDYALFEKSEVPEMKNLRRKLYDFFVSQGYEVYPERKELQHHYSHFIFEWNDKKIAVELGTQRLSANQVDKWNQEYKEKGIGVNWIVVDQTEKKVVEKQTFFLKRYGLNESINKSLVVIDWNGESVSQYIVDPEEYQFNGKYWTPTGFSETYQEVSDIYHLGFVNDELSIKGFFERYARWLERKRVAFISEVEKYKKNMEREVQKEILQQERERLRWENRNSLIKSRKQDEELHNQLREEVLTKMNQQKEQVRDSKGNRWIRCEVCGIIDRESMFSSYGGANHINLGICKKCVE